MLFYKSYIYQIILRLKEIEKRFFFGGGDKSAKEFGKR